MDLDLQTFRNFAIALFIGALAGIDREKRKGDPDYGGIGGLRTFILVAEAGALSAWLSVKADSVWIFAVTGAVVAVSCLVGFALRVRTLPTFPGMTTTMAALVVFLLGGAVMFGHAGVAVALAITTSAVLAYKEPLHTMVERIGRDDLYAGLRLLVATFIVLPVLPDRTIDPWGALNPYKVWLLVILIASISLIGYAVSRVLGSQRGACLTGVFGGLVSSTAVALEFAKRSRQDAERPGLAPALAAGIMLSWVVMFGRVLVLSAVVYGPLLQPLLLPIAVLAAVTAGCAWYLYRRTTREPGVDDSHDVPLKNPFSLFSAAKFGLLFVVILLVLKIVQRQYPGEGTYAVALLAGLTDVDVVTLSMAEFAKGGGQLSVAANAIALAAMANTLAKCAIVATLGTRALCRYVLVATLIIVAIAAAFLVPQFL